MRWKRRLLMEWELEMKTKMEHWVQFRAIWVRAIVKWKCVCARKEFENSILLPRVLVVPCPLTILIEAEKFVCKEIKSTLHSVRLTTTIVRSFSIELGSRFIALFSTCFSLIIAYTKNMMKIQWNYENTLNRTRQRGSNTKKSLFLLFSLCRELPRQMNSNDR